jgi:hypothetical protein
MRFVFAFLALALIRPALAEDLPADWAFKAYSRPDPPKSDKHNPIDAFILQELKKKNLSLSAVADKPTLLRRVTLDLAGLPPSAADLDVFLRDSSPDAFEKVVDRLLASPRYGERAALYWLDLVRFAESDGFKADDPRPNAWRYRDYVIDSFNADKPFERFIKEQLAGDELFSDDPASLVATGFLRHYPDEYNAVNLEQRRQEILNDVTDTTAQTFLGLTLGCAKCHDHKFDPITQEDYYRIQAFFAGWKPVEIPLLSKTERGRIERDCLEWDKKTAEIRQSITAMEKPHREKFSMSRRRRFPVEYANLLDVPEEKRTPLEKQIALMVEKQVYLDDKAMFSGMKPEEKARYEQLKKQLAELGPRPGREHGMAMGFTDVGTEVPATKLLKRGNWKAPRDEVKPGYLSAIFDRFADVKPCEKPTGRRSALALWLTKPDHPLTARVIVNRLWQQHFGRGIVASSGDFGKQGEKPTHPQLLNWLASELVNPSDKATPWTLKRIHRLIVTSAAYQQTSLSGDAQRRLDPENRLFSRQNRTRLDGEAIRDSILFACGELNLKMHGPSVFPRLPAEIKPVNWPVSADKAEQNRRSIYVYVKRNLRYPLFSAFDAPDRNETCSRRFVSTSAPQALMMLNEPIIQEQSHKLAQRIYQETGDNRSGAIDRLYRLTLSRSPTTEESKVMNAFFEKRMRGKPDIHDALADLCHAILNINEFIYVD